MTLILLQLIGVAALLMDVASLQFKLRRNILVMQIVASTTWVVHFFLLGAVSGAAMNAVGIVRSVSYYKFRDKKRLPWLPWMIVALSIFITSLTWQGAVSLLPMCAMAIAALAFWQKGEQVIRLLLILCVPLWFAYNLMFSSYAGMASDVIALMSGLVALYRYRRQGFDPAPLLTR